jgi:hypothetical protein
MTTAEALEAFVLAHQPHGPIRGDCGAVTPTGYLAWAACHGCGETLARWVTLAMMDEDERAGTP